MNSIKRISLSLAGSAFCLAVVLPSAAQAYCAEWGWSPVVHLQQSNGFNLVLTWQLSAESRITGLARQESHLDKIGQIIGSITGTGDVQFTIYWSGGIRGSYEAKVNLDDPQRPRLRGETRDVDRPQSHATWRSDMWVGCLSEVKDSPATGKPNSEAVIQSDSQVMKRRLDALKKRLHGPDGPDPNIDYGGGGPTQPQGPR